MAVTPTPRLGLNKQTPGDPNWGAPLNAGFDAADARFMTTSAGSPVGVQQGFYVGQTHFQTGTSPPTIWICTVVGSPGTWVLAGQIGLGYDGIAGALILNNTIALQGKDTVAVATNIAQVNAANDVEIGAQTRNIVLRILTAATGLGVRIGAGAIQKVWHEANDGPGSTLDADTLDGAQLAALMTKAADDLESAINITGTSGSYAHGLAGAPSDVSWFLEKISGAAEGGWVTNERIYRHAVIASNTLEIGADATTIYWARANGVEVVNKGGGGTTNLSLADWRLHIRAWL